MEAARENFLRTLHFPPGVYFRSPREGMPFTERGRGFSMDVVIDILKIVHQLETFEHQWQINQNVKEIDAAYLARDLEKIEGTYKAAAVGSAFFFGGIIAGLFTGGLAAAPLMLGGSAITFGTSGYGIYQERELNKIRGLMNEGQRYSVAKLTILQQRK